tara:strand:- start:29 stop:385 length:357 start_codon:yes stop_codon:yes gene_type:complete
MNKLLLLLLQILVTPTNGLIFKMFNSARPDAIYNPVLVFDMVPDTPETDKRRSMWRPAHLKQKPKQPTERRRTNLPYWTFPFLFESSDSPSEIWECDSDSCSLVYDAVVPEDESDLYE